MADQESNIKQENNTGRTGMNLDNSVSQIPKGVLSYALNAALENYDANSTSYQNEPGNELCVRFPDGFLYNGGHFIPEQNKHIFFLVNPETGSSEIGYMDNNDCVYHKYINADCLNFSIQDPILKVVHKITNCTTEIYWASKTNPRRFLDLTNLPYKVIPGNDICDNRTTSEIDCNKLNVQPNFSIPKLEVTGVVSGGNNIAGTVQFAFQYSDVAGDGYTSYYSVTNPTPIANIQLTTADFNYPVGKSIVLNISDIDTTGYFKYFNVAVIKTINAITSVELIGTYFIDNDTHQIIYSGQNQTQIRLTIGDIFEKHPFYEMAEDVTFVQDVLVWDKLTSIDRINYQQIANQITLQWETWRIPDSENYANELNATNFRGYLRDEVYPFEIVFLLDNGKQTDGFHIPGRVISYNELSHPEVPSTDPDFIGEPNPSTGGSPYWKIYNTASVLGTNSEYTAESSYKGPYQYGEFAYWESTETYPCNDDVWGELAGRPIRHHKFPDVRVSPIFENPTIETNPDGTYTNLVMEKRAIFPIGVKMNVQQANQLIVQSSLTQSQKDSIVGFKIVRGDRNTNKSIIAKGILRNVGKYTREGTSFYFPNYPYNDLREDPFLLSQPNAYNAESKIYKLSVLTAGTYQYIDIYTNKPVTANMAGGEVLYVCSLAIPTIISGTVTTPIPLIDFEIYLLTSEEGDTVFTYQDAVTETYLTVTASPGSPQVVQVLASTIPVMVTSDSNKYAITLTSYLVSPYCYPSNLSAFGTDDSKYRQVFNSPETSFGQPYLGNYLKLENAIFGAGSAHFVEVKNNALYRLISKEAQEDALESSAKVANISTDFSATAMFTTYQAYLQIYINGITRQNYGYSYNSIASYNYYSGIDNGLGVKQRNLDISQYLIPGVQSAGDNLNINNYSRETSVYLKTDADVTPLPFPKDTPSLILSGTTSAIEDISRYINSQKNCGTPNDEFDISTVCYYGAIKTTFINQWGQMYTYDTIDTGFQAKRDSLLTSVTIFGGDTFINQFSFKTKLPFFIDNRVGANDDADIFYDEIGNIAYPEFWHSSRSILFDYDATADGGTLLKNIISVKAHNFDCPNNQLPAPDSTVNPPVVNPDRTFYGGKMYMFAYGVPTFYCESSVNVDLRQAFNTREGDFFPHVSTGIPDAWVQESFVPIVQDNTYYYNVTFSKQNKENYFSHLPIDWSAQLCYTNFPFRAIYSDPQQSYTDNRINSWLIYKPSSFFDFPQNYGKLTSLDGIQNRQVLARFENKSLLYNALYTNAVNTGGQVYLGQPLFSQNVPPFDFAETDLGYVGSQNKFLLKIPQGQITVDAKRGQVFLISDTRAVDISAFGSGLNRFFTDHLSFEILRYFPTVDIDNHFTGVGLHGVYDSKYDRVIITKLDYIPLSSDVLYDEVENRFYINRMVGEVPIKTFVELTDVTYFCNKSWTISYNVNTQSWASFHTYLPNFYIGENNFFYSGLNESCDLEAIAGEIIYCWFGGTAEFVPPPTTTTTTTQTRYTYLVYNRDIECNTSSPVQYWSYISYAPGTYYINGGSGADKKFLTVSVHTNYSNEITSVVATTCEPICGLLGTAVYVS